MRRFIKLMVIMTAISTTNILYYGAWTPTRATGRVSGPDFRFVSSPDFLNTDVGDVTHLPGWDEGDPNSTNDSYETALDHVLDTWVSENPGSVLVAGDLVEGHWGMESGPTVDTPPTGIFGPLDTEEQKVAALKLAADTYYSEWQQRFVDHGLKVHTAIGDHEVGDNPWAADSANPWTRFKHRNLRVFKNKYAQWNVAPNKYFNHPPDGTPAAKTAYAKWIHPEVFLISVDVFRRTPDDVVTQLGSAQLKWLNGMLAMANRRNGDKTDGKTDWIIVQGHTPVWGPVRKQASSGLMFKNGRDSSFWQAMKKYRVDLYLCGEVHAITAKYGDGITQISHGGIFPGLTSYLVGSVHGDRLHLEVKKFVPQELSGSYLWQTDYNKAKGKALNVSYGPAQTVGTAIITKWNKVEMTSGVLDHFK